MSAWTCTHGTSLTVACDECRGMAGWSVARADTPRWCDVTLSGGPFDGDTRGLWWEGEPVEFYRTTVPEECGSFARIYWYRWDRPGQVAECFRWLEVPRDDRQAERMRSALGVEP